MNKIKMRATLYSLGLVVILIAIFIATIIQNKNKVLEEKTQAHRALLKNAFDLSLLDTQKGLQTLGYELAADRAIVDAFSNRNRETLYRLSIPYFNRAKALGEVDFAGFIGADGFHFLRLTEPQKFGDNITLKRPILAHAIQTRAPITALDVTLLDVAIVTIIPIFKDNQFIGVIQTVAKIDRVQKRLDAHSGIKSAIAFDSSALSKVLEANKNKIRYEGYTLVSSNDPLFSNLPVSFTFETSQRYLINNDTYVIASRPLYGFNQQKIAMMTCAFDITSDITQHKNEIRNLIVISIILTTFIGFILHFGFNILLRRINHETRRVRELYHELEDQHHTDYLTSLPNRNALIRDINNTHHHFYALFLLNIDNFKEINDFYGHDIGDETLLALTKSIQEAIHNLPMKLYKMPSDEYAIVLTEPMKSPQLEAARLSIFHHLQSKYYTVHGATIYITFTMGVDVIRNDHVTHSINLLANADIALKAAKKRHLSYIKYDESMLIKQEYQNNLLWSKKVKEAIEGKRFCLYYQPILNALTGELVEYEALIRIIDTDGSTISPGYFLPAAKQSRLYPIITQYVINEVFKKMESTPYNYSINLSVDDIFDNPTKQFLIHKLKSSPHAKRLIFELLESEGIENYPEVSSFIADVKQYGCQIAIDDFGTGYSNFAHILRLDVDILKIDGSLIRNIDTDSNAQTILIAVTEFSKRLGFKTVAEFVHSESVYTKCKELGIDYLQGYYLGEPKPLD